MFLHSRSTQAAISWMLYVGPREQHEQRSGGCCPGCHCPQSPAQHCRRSGYPLSLVHVPSSLFCLFVTGFVAIVNLNGVSDSGCCWNRIQSGSGSRPRFFMTKFLKNLQLDIFFDQNSFYISSYTPTKERAGSSNLKLQYLLFPFLGNKFALPGSGSGLPIRIRWPNRIRI